MKLNINYFSAGFSKKFLTLLPFYLLQFQQIKENVRK